MLVAIVDIRRHADFRESDRGEGAIDRVGEGKEDGGAVGEVDGLEGDGGIVRLFGFDWIILRCITKNFNIINEMSSFHF